MYNDAKAPAYVRFTPKTNLVSMQRDLGPVRGRIGVEYGGLRIHRHPHAAFIASMLHVNKGIS